MNPSTILFIAGIISAIGVVFFTLLAIKFRDNDDFVLAFVIATICCMSSTFIFLGEASEKATYEQQISVDVQSR